MKMKEKHDGFCWLSLQIDRRFEVMWCENWCEVKCTREGVLLTGRSQSERWEMVKVNWGVCKFPKCKHPSLFVNKMRAPPKAKTLETRWQFQINFARVFWVSLERDKALFEAINNKILNIILFFLASINETSQASTFNIPSPTFIYIQRKQHGISLDAKQSRHVSVTSSLPSPTCTHPKRALR